MRQINHLLPQRARLQRDCTILRERPQTKVQPGARFWKHLSCLRRCSRTQRAGALCTPGSDCGNVGQLRHYREMLLVGSQLRQVEFLLRNDRLVAETPSDEAIGSERWRPDAKV